MIPVLVVALPFLAAAACLFAGYRLPAWTAAAATAAAAVLAIVLLAGAGPVTEESVRLTPTGGIPILLGLRVTPLSATVGVMVTLVSLAVQVFSIGYLREKPRRPSYTAVVSLFTAAMLLVVFSADLLVLYGGWELMGLCSYFLIGYRWERPADTAAAVKAFLMTRAGDVGFLFGVFVLGLAAHSFRVAAVLAAAPHLPRATLLAGTLLLVLGIVAKSAQFPLHGWLPAAMAGPAPVSALIHAATMVAAGAYVVAELHPVFLLAPAATAVLAVLASVSMLGAALAALATDDLKRSLAYSTISQLGFVLAGLALGTTTAGMAQLLAHAAFKALLFLGTGVVLTATGSTALGALGGLRHRLPVTFATMTVGFAALAGIPPTSGFIGKDAVLSGLFQAGALPVFVLCCALLTVAVTAAYATRLWLRTFFGPPGPAAGPAAEGPAVLTVPLVALALAVLLLGGAALWIPVLRPDLRGIAVSLPLVALGVLGGFRGRAPSTGRLRTALARAGYTDDLWERTVVPVVMRLAAGVAHGEDAVLGRAVTGTGRGAARLGGALRLTQNGNVQSYVSAVLLGVLLLACGVVALR